MNKPARTLEIHEHAFIPESGPTRTIAHSHEGGEGAHRHRHCGPARYTIDKEAWAAATGGLKGGGRKAYTAKPSGEQMPAIALTDDERTFAVIFHDEYTPGIAAAGISEEEYALQREYFLRFGAEGAPAVERLKQEFGMVPTYEYRKPSAEGGAS